MAVKIMRGNNWDAKDEIERMKGLDHEHVLKLLGTVPPRKPANNFCNAMSCRVIVLLYVQC